MIFIDMEPLYTQKELIEAKSTDKLPLKCYHCNSTFYSMKKSIIQELKENRGRIKYCTNKCLSKHKQLREQVICNCCGNQFEKKTNQISKSKSGNHFCSKSCSVSYNNKHKTTGNRRSKLEAYLEEQLTNLYPSLEIHYNQKSAINSELDIYIPSLNLAFELNGIFHYEPIFGTDKLGKIQENDKSKSKICFDNKIDLCIIDTSGQKYVKPSTSQKYLDIIKNIINSRCV